MEEGSQKVIKVRLLESSQVAPPVIRYVNGDSITLTVAESNADFTHLCGYHARHAKDFQHLIPPLLTPDHHTTNFKDVPVFAAQVTLFPNSGICLGVTFLHAMMDGRAMAFFLKSWASTSRFGHSPHEESLLPFFDRYSVILKDVHGLQKHSLQMFLQFMQSKSMPEQDCANWLMLTSKVPITNQVFATFELKGVDIDMFGFA
ncbi:hypothetical protein Scep_011711 [Stephania cephalantha]|uniref:Uncharacterized protein n=1 Tax=Stephania cephalantha TaxID=152367 RepID=A0AAP0JFN1_9MAGN